MTQSEWSFVWKQETILEEPLKRKQRQENHILNPSLGKSNLWKWQTEGRSSQTVWMNDWNSRDTLWFMQRLSSRAESYFLYYTNHQGRERGFCHFLYIHFVTTGIDIMQREFLSHKWCPIIYTAIRVFVSGAGPLQNKLMLCLLVVNLILHKLKQWAWKLLCHFQTSWDKDAHSRDGLWVNGHLWLFILVFHLFAVVLRLFVSLFISFASFVSFWMYSFSSCMS